MKRTRKHVYRATSLGKGCSPAKTASARINGTKGGRPPQLRYAATGRRGYWTVLDRVTGTTEAADTQQAARELARALNTTGVAPAPPARPVAAVRPAPTPSGLPRVVPRRA